MVKKAICATTLFAFLLSQYSAYADQVADNFAQGAAMAQSLHDAAGIQNLNPNDLPNFNPNPEETQYFGMSDAEIRQAGLSKTGSDEVGSVINNSFKNRPKITINSASPEIQKSALMQQDAYNITHGISDQYVSCENQKTCHTEYYDATCNSTANSSLTCYQTPVVTLVDEPYQTQVAYSGVISETSNNSGTITLPEDGTMVSFSASLNSGNVWRCNTPYNAYVNGGWVGSSTGHCGHDLGGLGFSAGNLNIPMTKDKPNVFSFSGPSYGYWRSANYSLTMNVTRYRKVPQVTTQNTCSSIPDMCSLSSTQCVEAGETRTFEGVPVTQDCWKTQQDYTCGLPDDHSCDALQQQGCSQSNSQCTQMFNGSCIQYQNTYQCPEQVCDGSSVICGGDFYCLDGQCYTSKSEQNQNFAQDASAMAGASAAAQDIANDQNAHIAFAGNGMSCSKDPVGFTDCCASSGWGMDIGLGNCTEDEKKLGASREKGLAVEVGTYCAHDVLGVCTSYRESFCVFNQILAYDIQYYGRLGQLGISFGDAESPNCQGLTIDELSRINFQKIDWSNVANDIKNNINLPVPKDIQESIEEAIKRKVNP